MTIKKLDASALEEDDDDLMHTGDEDSGDDDRGQGREDDHDDDHDDDDSGPEDSARDAGAEASEDDEAEREAIRERRRNERRTRKERAREREDNYRRELAARDTMIQQLSERLNQIDRRNNGVDIANIDNQMQHLNVLYTQERERVAKAVENKNGADVVAAQENMMKIRDRFNQLNHIKQAYVRDQQAPQPLDPRLIKHAQEWQEKNKWYKVDGQDTDSKVVRVIDDQLAAEGWNPSTKEYWDELTNRVRKHLPFHFEKKIINKRSPPSPVAGSSQSGRTANSNGGSGSDYSLSKERVQAMKDAGLWSNPEKRKLAIERYRQYDEAHKGE